MTPGFGRPTAFSRPASSSTIVGFGYPSLGCGPTLFVTTAPAPAWYTRPIEPSVSSRNPDASIVGFRRATPAISVRRSTIGPTEPTGRLKALGGRPIGFANTLPRATFIATASHPKRNAYRGPRARLPHRGNPEGARHRGALPAPGRCDWPGPPRREPRPRDPDRERQVPRSLPRDPRLRSSRRQGAVHRAAAGPRHGEVRSAQGIRTARHQGRNQHGRLRLGRSESREVRCHGRDVRTRRQPTAPSNELAAEAERRRRRRGPSHQRCRSGTNPRGYSREAPAGEPESPGSRLERDNPEFESTRRVARGGGRDEALADEYPEKKRVDRQDPPHRRPGRLDRLGRR